MIQPRQPSLNSTTNLSPNDAPKVVAPTIRLELDLSSQKNKYGYAEFSYAELVKKSSRQQNGEKQPSFFEDSDEGLEEQAKAFEIKYGIDRGAGYDENDSFIDNADPYDELVPLSLETELGGFYINRGSLDFKHISNSETSEIPKDKKKMNLKDSENDSENAKNERKTKVHKDSHGYELESGESYKIKKKRRLKDSGNENVKKNKIKIRIHKDYDGNKAESVSPSEESEKHQKSTVDLPSTEESSSSSKLFLESKQPNTPDQKSSLIIKKETVKKAEVASAAEKMAHQALPTPKVESFRLTNPEKIHFPTLSPAGKNPPAPENIKIFNKVNHGIANRPSASAPPKLPEGLNTNLLGVIDFLKKVASSHDKGKSKFFSLDVNKRLLQLDMLTKALSMLDRSAVFSHLATFLPCTKNTLLQRIRKLRQVRDAVDQIQEDADQVQPQLVEPKAVPEFLEKFEECNHNGKFSSRSNGKENDIMNESGNKEDF